MIDIRIIDPFIKEGVKMVAATSRNGAAGGRSEADAAVAPGPRLRADARRNEGAILEAAKIVFARSGVDAPIREIAAEAGVGLATLYRRFATRADLVAAVFRREVDACAAAAAPLATEREPADALAAWLMHYTRFLATKRGLAAALHSGDPAFASLPVYFRSRFEPALSMLMTAAAEAGEVRGDVAPYDLLRAIGNLAVAPEKGGAAHTEKMVMLLIDGLRYGRARAE
jgi:AcrR family transcriptional regulator